MKYITRTILFLLPMLLCKPKVHAQCPYNLDLKKEFSYAGVGLGLGIAGLVLRSQTDILSSQEIAALQASSINGFDREATNNYSTRAHQVSNYFFWGSVAAPVLFLQNRKMRSNFLVVSLLWSESQLINIGLVVLTKYSAKRTRPFVYNDLAPLDEKQHTTARTSFFSGHASVVACNSFFFAKVFTDYNPDSNWRYPIWAAAITLPAITSYLRVKGGRHFPTDVITGYIVGAGIGILVPQMHKVKNMEKVSFAVTPFGARLGLKIE